MHNMIATSPQRSRKTLLERISPPFAAFLATLMALPVNAGITIPDDPLTTGSRVPPNILFILDDSGSMAFDTMENPVVPTVCGRNTDGSCISGTTITDLTYVGNTVYYNPFSPAAGYQPWVNAAGTPLTGGTSYGAAYASLNNATDPIDLSNAGSCATIDRNGSSRSVCGGVQTFYVPMSTSNTSTAYLRNAYNYYRYQILTNGTIQRSVLGNVVNSGTTAVAVTPATGTVNNSSATHILASVSGGGGLDVTITSTNDRSKDYQVRDPSGNTVCSGNVDDNEARTCSINPAASGAYTVVVSRSNNNNGTYSLSASSYTSNRCGAGTGSVGWINCTNNVPGTRDAAAERANYATWFSYHRTRMKAAKAGASSAFSDLGTDVRVGFRTIWRRAPGGTRPGNEPNQAVPIPVNYNNGRFADPNGPGGANDNRTKWFDRLHNATGQDGTPLHGALRDAGEYFTSTASNGPYGPETGVNQYACRQNFAILTTDGYWNNNSNYTTAVGQQDGTNGSQITGPNNAPYTYTAAAPYSDTQSDTLADVAMYYWKNDLRAGTGGLANVVPTTTANPAFWQHMVTFGISIGLRGTLDPSSDWAGVQAGTTAWPNPWSQPGRTDTGWGEESERRIDDLWHAAVNGHGTFLSASDPLAFANGLKAALATISERTGSFSNVAANSARLQAGTQLFQASYVTGVWTGELAAFDRLPPPARGFSATAAWRASAGIPATGRKVFTSDGTSGLAFPASATTTQLAALTRTGGASNYPVTGADNAAYLAGDRSREISGGGTLRNRNHLLGDIVSSSPAYVSDTQTIYVNANDGMLHAFNASNGQEEFAYIPNAVDWSRLGDLSRPDYAHRYSVDGPVVVSSRKQTPNRNILVGTLGRGGKGMFALDVTNPGSFGANDFEWEQTETTNGLMGQVFSRPIIAKLNNNVNAVIVANGPNSTAERAALLIYNLDTGALISEIDTGSGSAAAPNGLFSPVGIDQDGSGTIDYVYAGDMLGNVWKFNLTSATSGTWDDTASRTRLFTAVSSTGTVQPITGGLTLGMNPSTYKTWVFFGTGRFVTTGDVTDQSVQSLYGFEDSNTTLARTALTSRRTVVATTKDGQPVRAFEANQALPAGSKGWYIDLLTPPTPPGTAEGERIVTAPQMDGSVLEVSSIIPTAASACQADGRGYLNAMDAFTGTSAKKPYFDVDGDGDFSDETVTYTDSNGNTVSVPIGSVDMGVGMVTQGSLFSGNPDSRGLICAGGSAGGLGCRGKDDPRNVGRVSWREIKQE